MTNNDFYFSILKTKLDFTYLIFWEHLIFMKVCEGGRCIIGNFKWPY